MTALTSRAVLNAARKAVKAAKRESEPAGVEWWEVDLALRNVGHALVALTCTGRVPGLWEWRHFTPDKPRTIPLWRLKDIALRCGLDHIPGHPMWNLIRAEEARCAD